MLIRDRIRGTTHKRNVKVPTDPSPLQKDSLATGSVHILSPMAKSFLVFDQAKKAMTKSARLMSMLTIDMEELFIFFESIALFSIFTIFFLFLWILSKLLLALFIMRIF